VPFSQLALRHADRLTLAAFSTPSGDVIGPECIAGATTVALGPERASSLFGFVNLDQEDDGVSRRARLSYRDREGGARSSFAAKAASTIRAVRQPGWGEGGEVFWIDHTIDAARFDRVSWKDLDSTLRTRPELFQDRLIIVGGDFSGSGDDPRVPIRGAIPGVVLQGMLADTILSNFPVRGIGDTAALLATGIACGLLCAVVLVGTRPYRLAEIVLLVGATYTAGVFVYFSFARVLLPLTAPLLSCGLGCAVAWSIRLWRPRFPGA
jgi:CHASE2 domain-containing sensor protein